jgi:hypothetical protein
MYKICLVFLLAAPVALYSQSSNGQSSSVMVADHSSVSSGSSSATGLDGGAAAPEGGAAMQGPQSSTQPQGFFRRGFLAPSVHDAPVGSFTASYVYQFAPNYVGADRSLMGWSAMPEVNFTKYLGLQAEFTGLYMRGVYPGQNRLMMAAGPRVTLAPHSKFTPFLFAEGGEIRATQQLSDVSDWNPVVSGGIGLNYEITRGVSFELIPGQYVGQLEDNHDWNHSFMTKAGITFNLYR